MMSLRTATWFGLALLVQGCANVGTLSTEACGNLAVYTFFGEGAEDYAGYWVTSAGDVDGDGLDDVLIGAYDNDENGPGAGAAYLILGQSLNGPATQSIARADYKFLGEAPGDYAGIMVASAGDIDNDGLDDLLIGAYGTEDKGAITGRAYIVLARSLGQERTIDLTHADFTFVGEAAEDYAGYAVAKGGDIDGDGRADVLIAASGHGAGGENAGATYVFLGKNLVEGTTVEMADADYKLYGEHDLAWSGHNISGDGDVDGDGLDDIFIGATGDDGGTDAYASYLFLGRNLGPGRVIGLSQADYKLIGEDPYDYASQVSIAGDLDGDGRDDLVVGAGGRDAGGDSAGAAYVVLARSLGDTRLFDLAEADYVFLGEGSDDYAGGTVGPAGDVDGDGLDDFMIGALYYNGDYPNQGAAYLILGKSLGGDREIDLAQADLRFAASRRDQYLGHSVFTAGDVDGDGLDDMLVGSWAGPNWTGAAYLVTGAAVVGQSCSASD
tara:strand:- start:538 stop:2028 length:1491 start_codon:yes stop_codon:yes gene_type:complete